MKAPGFNFVLVAAAALAAALPGRAAERVTLSNGFVEMCNHHETVGGRVRLYVSADGNSYIEFPASQVTGVENVADAPAAEPPAAEPRARNAVAPLQSGLEPAPSKLDAADLHQIMVSAGHAHHLDVDLLASVVKAESGGNPRATSRAGAGGLMQLMPGTADELGVTDRYAPEQNVRGGSAYLDELLTKYHDDLKLALAAYNAGPAAVDRYHGIPPYRETRVYVARVIREYNRRVRARERAAAQAGPTTEGQ